MVQEPSGCQLTHHIWHIYINGDLIEGKAFLALEQKEYEQRVVSSCNSGDAIPICKLR